MTKKTPFVIGDPAECKTPLMTATNKAQRVSPFEPDHQCEHCEGNIQCERRAAAWTIANGSGYIVGCTEHAQELLDAAVAEGDIYDLTTEGHVS